MSDFYPYFWQLQFDEYEYNYQMYIPYLDVISSNINENTKNVYINPSSLFVYCDNKQLCDFFLKLQSKVEYDLFSNRLILQMKYVDKLDYTIQKWNKRLLINTDCLYIYKSCIKEIFENVIIYLIDKTIYVFLDYNKSEQIENTFKKIDEYFLPIELNSYLIFENLLVLDTDCKLERWVVI